MLINPEITDKATIFNYGEYLQLGIYQNNHWNFEYCFSDITQWEMYPELTVLLPKECQTQWFHAYGVCDSPEQFMEAAGYLLAEHPTRKFCVSLVQLRKAEQASDGGWRWHKWGPYIGKQEPQCEYLFDEPVIEEVWTYHIYEKIK